MSDAPKDTIKVSESPIPAALAALVRQAVLALCGIAATKGWFSLGDSTVEQYVVPVAIGGVTLLYGQFKTWLIHSKLAYLVPFVDDSIARFK